MMARLGVRFPSEVSTPGRTTRDYRFYTIQEGMDVGLNGFVRIHEEDLRMLVEDSAELAQIRQEVVEEHRAAGEKSADGGRKIIAGLTEAVSYARGDQGGARVRELSTEERRAMREELAEGKTGLTRLPAGMVEAGDVRWVVNDDAELGVEIGGRFFFLFRGVSLEYHGDPEENNRPAWYRPVRVQEFGDSVCKSPRVVASMKRWAEMAESGRKHALEAEGFLPLPSGPHKTGPDFKEPPK